MKCTSPDLFGLGHEYIATKKFPDRRLVIRHSLKTNQTQPAFAPGESMVIAIAVKESQM